MPAKKSSPKRTTTRKKSEAPAPMDAGAREVLVGTPSVNNQRVCWAAKTLIAEVHEVFPETPVEFSNYDGRNTALDVTFDLTGVDGADRSDLLTLLTLFDDERVDPRVKEVLVEDDSVLVSFRSSARTQDDRSPFGILDALSVLSGPAQETSL